MFKSQDTRQLPTFKDKPYNHSSASSSATRPLYRRRRTILAAVLLVLGLILWFTAIRGSSTSLAGSWLGKDVADAAEAIVSGGKAAEPEIEMEMVSGGEVPKGARPKLMRQGGKAWIEMADGTRQGLGAKKAL